MRLDEDSEKDNFPEEPTRSTAVAQVHETDEEREIHVTNKGSAVIFSLRNQVGGLVRALRIFQVYVSLSLTLVSNSGTV